MKMKDCERVNGHFSKWKGATARFNKYTTSHNRFVVALKRQGSDESVGVSFTFCEYIAGPTHWTNCDLQCSLWTSPGGEEGYEVSDKNAGFIVRGTDVVILGEDDDL